MNIKFSKRIISFLLILVILFTPLINTAKAITNTAGEAIVDNDDFQIEYEIEDSINKFKNVYSKKDRYSVIESIALNRAGYNLEDIAQKIDIKELSFEVGKGIIDYDEAKEYAIAILGIIAAGKDPYNYEGKNYVEFLVENQVDDGYFSTSINSWDEKTGDDAENLAYSILALDAAKANYDRDGAIARLLSKFKVEDGYVKISGFGDVFDKTLLSFIAVSGDVDESFKKKAIDYINSEKTSDGLFEISKSYFQTEFSTVKTSRAIQTLVALGDTSDTRGVEKILDLVLDGEIKENNYEITDDSTAYGTIALLDFINKESSLKKLEVNVEDELSELKIYSNDLQSDNKVKINKNIEFKGYAIAGDFVERDLEIEWRSDNPGVFKIDKDTGFGKAESIGKANIEGKIKGTDIKSSIEIEVVEVHPKEIILSSESGTQLEVGKSTSISVVVKDTDDENYKPDIKWELEPKELVKFDEENLVITGLKPGNVKLRATVEGVSNELEIDILTKKDMIKLLIDELRPHVMEEEYDYSIAMALNMLGVDKQDIAQNLRRESKYFPSNIKLTKDILGALAIGEDPYDYYELNNGNKDFIKELIDRNFYAEKDIENLSMSIIALDMAEANYNEELAIENLIELLKGKSKHEKSLSFALIALDNHRDLSGVEEEVVRIIKLMQNADKGEDIPLIMNTETHSALIQSLIKVGENIYAENWIYSGENEDTFDLFESLKEMKRQEGKFGSTSSDEWGNTTQTQYVFPALVEMYFEKSMYNEFSNMKIDNYEIEISQEDLEIKQGEEKALEVKTYLNGKEEDLEVVWESSDEEIISIDESGLILALKPGKVKVFASIKGFENIKDQIEVEVVETRREANRLEIKLDAETPIVVGDSFKINAKVYDEYGNILDDEIVDLEIKDDNILKFDENNYIKALKQGETEIIGKVRNTDISTSLKLVVFKSREDGENTLSKFIDALEKYYNEEHFIESNGQLSAEEYMTFSKAGFDIQKWYVVEDLLNYDTNLKYIGNKAVQAMIMLETNRDPRNYKGRDLIDEIVNILNEDDLSHANSSKLKGIIAVNKYNEKYPENKVKYNEEIIINKIRKAQKSDGGFFERDESVVVNTGLALQALSKMEFEGRDEIVGRAVEYLKGQQKNDGGFYGDTFITNNNVEAIKGLLEIGEDLTSEDWNKGGYNPIESMFNLWKINNSFDNARGESENNRGWVSATQKSLDLLVDLVNSGYENYIVKTATINGGVKEYEEMRVNTAIVLKDSANEYTILSRPEERIINTKDHRFGFSALGALEATTELFDVNGTFVNSIHGYENKGSSGWKYSVNGIEGNTSAGAYMLQPGDKVIWYYAVDMKDAGPSWEELLKPHVEYNLSIEPRIESVRVGDEIEIVANVRKNDEKVNEELIWESSNSEILKIREDGERILMNALKEGEATIRVSLKNQPGIYDEMSVKAETSNIEIKEVEREEIVKGKKVRLRYDVRNLMSNEEYLGILIKLIDKNGNTRSFARINKMLDSREVSDFEVAFKINNLEDYDIEIISEEKIFKKAN